MKNNKTRFFYVLYSDKTWVFDQSERAQGPIHIKMIIKYNFITVGRIEGKDGADCLRFGKYRFI